MSLVVDSPLDSDAMSRRGVEARLGLVVLSGGLAMTFADALPLLVWIAATFLWELIAPIGTRRLIVPVYARDRGQAMSRQTALSFVGACIYGVFPFLVFPFGGIAGAVMGVGWIVGTAIHAFVYLIDYRGLLIGALIPPVVAAIAAPLMAMGATQHALVASVAALYLIAAAAAFGFDRNKLLVELTQQSTARDAAEEIARAKSRVLAVVTHELRTPLNAIINYSEMLAEDIRDGAADVRDAERIREASGDLLKLVNRVIDVSRIEAGQITSECIPTHIGDFLSDIILQLSPAAAQQGNELAVRSESAADEVVIDAVNARRCLICIGENAVKFTRNGSVTFCAERSGHWLEIAVADTGVGMNAETKSRLFTLFMQSNSSAARAHEGMGLGLALAAGLARVMRGSILVESEIGQGSTFTLRLPLARAATS